MFSEYATNQLDIAHRFFKKLYPTPTLSIDAALHDINTWRVLLLAACALVFAGSDMRPALAQDLAVKCDDGKVCRVVDTKLPLRILPKVDSLIFTEKNESSQSRPAAPFRPLFVFERDGVSFDDATNTTGWYAVSTSSTGTPTGFMRAQDALEWKTAIVLAYTHPGEGDSRRKPVLMFSDRKPLEDLLTAADRDEKAKGYYERLESNDVPDGVISREPDTFVDIKNKFYMLPILQAVDVSFDTGADQHHVLQLASAVPTGRATSDQQCIAGRANFNECMRKASALSDESLRVNVVYVMDTSGSMQPYIDAVRDAIRNTSRSLFSRIKGSADAIRLGIVAFRDNLTEYPEGEFVAKNYTPEFVDHKRFVTIMSDDVGIKGNIDWPEEVFAGVDEALRANWDAKAIKLLILIGDASSHEPSHRLSTTQKSALELRQAAGAEDIYVASIYIKNEKNPEDWPIGIQQFKELARNPGAAGDRTFWAVGQSSDEIRSALQEATAIMVEHIEKVKAGTNPTTSTPSTRNVVATAFNIAMVEFIGRATEPPKDITAWVSDRDITNLERRSLDVHVLVSRTDLDTLAQNLQHLVDAYELNEMTGEGFLKSLQTLTTLTTLDGDLSKATALKNSSLIPAWIRSLPYKSEMTELTFEDLEGFTPDQRQDSQQRVKNLIGHYRSLLERRDAWVKLNEDAAADDRVYPLRLDNLP